MHPKARPHTLKPYMSGLGSRAVQVLSTVKVEAAILGFLTGTCLHAGV